MNSGNVLKCKYCEYKVSRWKGRGNHGGNRLWKHVVDKHEEEFLTGIGWNGSLEEYIDMIAEKEYNDAIKNSQG